MPQVGYLQELYRDAWSAKHKKTLYLLPSLCFAHSWRSVRMRSFVYPGIRYEIRSPNHTDVPSKACVKVRTLQFSSMSGLLLQRTKPFYPATFWVYKHNKGNVLAFCPALTFRHRASCLLGQAFHYSPENAFYIFNQQIYFII